MYLNFSNFRGRTSAGGGQALVQKRGQVSDGGGDWQNFRRMGGGGLPSPLQEKNPVPYHGSSYAGQWQLGPPGTQVNFESKYPALQSQKLQNQ